MCVYAAEQIRTIKSADSENRVGKMQVMLEKQLQGLPKPANKIRESPRQETVLLTGSTGSLGSYLLENLCSASTVEKIYCLNRCDDGKERQREANSSRGLTSNGIPNVLPFCEPIFQSH